MQVPQKQSYVIKADGSMHVCLEGKGYRHKKYREKEKFFTAKLCTLPACEDLTRDSTEQELGKHGKMRKMRTRNTESAENVVDWH